MHLQFQWLVVKEKVESREHNIISNFSPFRFMFHLLDCQAAELSLNQAN